MNGERLKALRMAIGKRQKEVADALHISRGAYGSYENGRRMPPADILALLALYFNTTADYLLNLSDDALPPPSLDERSRELLRCFLDSDPRGRETIYRMALQEKLQYGGNANAEEAP
ncbi:MAG: helix-turn-helix transcriptional regulator [Lachnospiraceae bacterium]|nr:helix-turn-helix transcriptional regulator [Lachnospiraceae bacterium]